jgi:hypothetical protein
LKPVCLRPLLISLCLAPGAALASADPGLIWWTAGTVALQVFVGVLLWRVPRVRPLRNPALIAYVLLLIPSWLWGANVPGPDFAMVHAAVVGVPVLYLLGVSLGAMTIARLLRRPRE